MKKKLYLFLHLMLKISWKSDKVWLQENVLKINGFIWNILIGKYFWPVSVYIKCELIYDDNIDIW
jgi:hypothetical protein